MCHYGNLHTQLQVMFVSSTEIKCVLPKTHTTVAKANDVILSFASYKRTENTLNIKHHIAQLLPEVTSARFGNKLNRIIITFTGGVYQRDHSVTVRDLLPY